MSVGWLVVGVLRLLVASGGLEEPDELSFSELNAHSAL